MLIEPASISAAARDAALVGSVVVTANGNREIRDRLEAFRCGAVGGKRLAWTSIAPPEELSIQEHAEAITLVDDLRPHTSRWCVELQRPEISREIGLIIVKGGTTPAWAIYRDESSVLHFEDLLAGKSYLFGSMSAGLRFVRAVLTAAAAIDAESVLSGSWWEGLPPWLLADASRHLEA